MTVSPSSWLISTPFLRPADLALVRLVAVEDVADQAGAARQVQELVLEADQAARRDAVLEAHAAPAVRLHVDQLALALAELLHHAALVLVLDVDRHQLDRLVALAVLRRGTRRAACETASS